MFSGCYTELFLSIPLKIFERDNLYDEAVVNVTAATVTSSTNDFKKIEAILYEKLLGANIWCALLASDIWYLVLK